MEKSVKSELIMTGLYVLGIVIGVPAALVMKS